MAGEYQDGFYKCVGTPTFTVLETFNLILTVERESLETSRELTTLSS